MYICMHVCMYVCMYVCIIYSMSHRGNVLDLVRLLLLQQEAISREEALVREVVIFDSSEGQRKLVVAKSLVDLHKLHTYIHTVHILKVHT